MSSIIWKVVLSVIDHQIVEIPVGSEILTVQVQKDIVCMWYKHDGCTSTEFVDIYIVGTGNKTSEKLGEYISTFQMYDGDLVFHVFKGL